MFQNLYPKCANPSCATAFDWLSGGRLFRFHRDPERTVTADGDVQPAANAHHVEHFWLCEKCSQTSTLNYDSVKGVLIRPLLRELPAAKDKMSLPAA